MVGAIQERTGTRVVAHVRVMQFALRCAIESTNLKQLLHYVALDVAVGSGFGGLKRVHAHWARLKLDITKRKTTETHPIRKLTGLLEVLRERRVRGRVCKHVRVQTRACGSTSA